MTKILEWTMDLAFLLGILLTIHGLQEIYHPLGAIAGGLALAAVAVLFRYRRQ